MKINYSIVMVSDMARSITFYRDTIGIPLKFETSHWTEFATEGATLALHLAEKPSESDRSEEAGQCRLGFSVPDLDRFHQEMTGKGVVCRKEPHETFGAKLAHYEDPDGLLMTVSEEKGNHGND